MGTIVLPRHLSISSWGLFHDLPRPSVVEFLDVLLELVLGGDEFDDLDGVGARPEGALIDEQRGQITHRRSSDDHVEGEFAALPVVLVTDGAIVDEFVAATID